jgi:hypothetical protein
LPGGRPDRELYVLVDGQHTRAGFAFMAVRSQSWRSGNHRRSAFGCRWWNLRRPESHRERLSEFGCGLARWGRPEKHAVQRGGCDEGTVQTPRRRVCCARRAARGSQIHDALVLLTDARILLWRWKQTLPMHATR